MKIVVIGCTHAGTAAVVNIKENYPDSEVVIYEKNNNVSFLSCGIALNVGKVIDTTEKLFYSSPEALNSLGAQTKMQHEVLNIYFKNKKLSVKDLLTNEVFEDNYDKLVLTLGSWPIVPKFEGGTLDNIVLCKNYNHALNIIEKSKYAKNVVVIGAGYIGVELAEAFKMQGKNTTLIDAENRIMAKYLDKEFTDIAETEFKNKGVNIVLGQKVQKFEGTNTVEKVITDKGEYNADLVVLCIGFTPNTKLVQGKLETLPNGAIIIDEYMRTSEEDVFAAGDCCVVKYNPAKDTRYIPLATNAVRMGTLVGKNLIKPTLKYMGTQGTSGIKIYNKCIDENYRPEFMPTFEEAKVKLVFDKDSRKILGGQIISNIDLTQYMNTLSVVIQNEMTIEELAMTDFFFQPHFNKPWSLLNAVALKAL